VERGARSVADKEQSKGKRFRKHKERGKAGLGERVVEEKERKRDKEDRRERGGKERKGEIIWGKAHRKGRRVNRRPAVLSWLFP
jgi:hypothetical protein